MRLWREHSRFGLVRCGQPEILQSLLVDLRTAPNFPDLAFDERRRIDCLQRSRAVRRQVAKQIAPVADEDKRLKRPPQKIKEEAEAMLKPLNNGAHKLEATQTIQEFVAGVYFPNLEKMARVSTVKFCKSRWELQLKRQCDNSQLP